MEVHRTRTDEDSSAELIELEEDAPPSPLSGQQLQPRARFRAARRNDALALLALRSSRAFGRARRDPARLEHRCMESAATHNPIRRESQ